MRKIQTNRTEKYIKNMYIYTLDAQFRPYICFLQIQGLNNTCVCVRASVRACDHLCVYVRPGRRCCIQQSESFSFWHPFCMNNLTASNESEM